ncbi:MAG: hypothetical protein GX941_06475 [Candidatus Methanofastidiosa archaeon]|jgi:adenosylcobinamide hydrolase|nr:hypothetical protein [Candidatus Methanofastidiosa archaeon]HOM95325.1 adenosylcobinamide amidohydrolase [Methanofastidiosum sp.]HPC80776.1 adenosylcobinamide amidohydrolase [Methanofastidiosum sp.]HRS25088.1 adenosylcobinamide amidohydrolase [Methanofastidiosum sp.]
MKILKEKSFLSGKVKLRIYDDFFVVESDESLKTYSSAILGGGKKFTRTFIGKKVEKNYISENPEKDLQEIEKKIGAIDSVGMMTACDVKNLFIKEENNVLVFLTAGVSNASLAGEMTSVLTPCTINIYAIIDANLEEEAYVGGIITMTEAKTRALLDLDIRSVNSYRNATGTTTDSALIASTGNGKKERYMSTGTKIGKTLGELVYEGVYNSLVVYDKNNPQRSLASRLRERGIILEDIIKAEMELFIDNDDITRDEFKSLFQNELEYYLKETNVSSLIIAGLRAEEDGYRGIIPGLPKSEFEKDPIHLIADEAIGDAIASYIGGYRGIFEFRRVERIKPGIIGGLGPFMDDALGGLIAGISSKIFQRINR